jgi:hypothetical protein
LYVSHDKNDTKGTLCLRCKGLKLLCGKADCPLLTQYRVRAGVKKMLSRDVRNASPPGIFVGWKGYPKVQMGPMVSIGDLHGYDPHLLDDPGRWYGSKIEDIIIYRSSLIRSKQRLEVNSAKDPDYRLKEFQELVLSIKPVDVEMLFSKMPKFHILFSPMSEPMPSSAPLEIFSLEGTPSIPAKVDKIYSDTDLNAKDALYELHMKGYDEYYLTKILSAGTLGLGKRRRLVPTRWSITAVDDILGKKMIEEVGDLPSVDEYLIFENRYLGNRFEILFIPGEFEFENIECWLPGSVWSMGEVNIIEEYESRKGRREYAEREGGGYYAARLPILEKMLRLRKKAKVVCLREIGEEYYLPVGVWEVRENVKRALLRDNKRFSTLDESLSYIKGRLRVDIGRYTKVSRIIEKERTQRTLSKWFGK